MLMNVVITIVVIEMSDVKIVLDHTYMYVNVLLDMSVMVIYALISTSFQPRATRVVKIKIVKIPMVHIIAFVKPDILLKMKNVSASTKVIIKLVIPLQFALITLSVSHMSVKMDSEVMALVMMISLNVKVVCTTAIWLQNVATSLAVFHENVTKDGKMMAYMGHVRYCYITDGITCPNTTRLNLKLIPSLNVFVTRDMS